VSGALHSLRIRRENRNAADESTRVCAAARTSLFTPSYAPRTALVHRSVAAAEYITHPMM
jgi:hypothetical protein